MYKVNQLIRDEYGRVHGVLAINKPHGLTSHDVVARVRHILQTRQVGHAGALDPFATGLLLVLVGKATKLSDSYLHQDKEYKAKVLIGIKTDSGDPEGEIIETAQTPKVPENVDSVLQSFVPEYEQYVPVFSSIKYQGEKLRVLARTADKWEIKKQPQGKQFSYTRKGIEHVIDIPKRICKINYLNLLEEGSIDLSTSEFFARHSAELSAAQFPSLDILVGCSKGTFVRVLAEDIGDRLSPPMPAMLWELERTRIGDISSDNSLTLEQLAEQFTPAATNPAE